MANRKTAKPKLDAATFVEQMYGNDFDGYLSLWSKQTKQTRFYQSSAIQALIDDIDDLKDEEDLYLGFSTQKEDVGPKKRGGVDSIVTFRASLLIWISLTTRTAKRIIRRTRKQRSKYLVSLNCRRHWSKKAVTARMRSGYSISRLCAKTAKTGGARKRSRRSSKPRLSPIFANTDLILIASAIRCACTAFPAHSIINQTQPNWSRRYHLIPATVFPLRMPRRWAKMMEPKPSPASDPDCLTSTIAQHVVSNRAG